MRSYSSLLPLYFASKLIKIHENVSHHYLTYIHENFWWTIGKHIIIKMATPLCEWWWTTYTKGDVNLTIRDFEKIGLRCDYQQLLSVWKWRTLNDLDFVHCIDLNQQHVACKYFKKYMSSKRVGTCHNVVLVNHVVYIEDATDILSVRPK